MIDANACNSNLKYIKIPLPIVGIVIIQNEFENGVKLHRNKKIQTICTAIFIVNIVQRLDVKKDKITQLKF